MKWTRTFWCSFAKGKRVGYRFLGDVDVLALPDDEPRYSKRFYYSTTPLPRALTKGKDRSASRDPQQWAGVGLCENVRGLSKADDDTVARRYRVATHTDGCFIPPADEAQGEAPADMVRTQPGAEVLDAT